MPATATSEEYVTGLSDLVDRLNQLPLALGTQKNIIARNLRLGSMVIRDEASRLAPVYDGFVRVQKRRGKAFTLVPGKLRDTMLVVVKDQTATGATAWIGVAAGAWYGSKEEFGTGRQAATPFLRPALDAKIDEAVAVIGYGIGSDIEKQMAKL